VAVVSFIALFSESDCLRPAQWLAVKDEPAQIGKTVHTEKPQGNCAIYMPDIYEKK
jgi:hypothetical protein